MRAFDIIILGAGSAGFGAAITAARAGMRVALIERFNRIGGTAAWAGVNCWEPGVCSSNLPREIYERLRKIPDAVGVYSMARHCCRPVHGEPTYPGGENLIDTQKTYDDTLRRHGVATAGDPEEFRINTWHGVVFEPAAYESVICDMLEESGNCEIMRNAYIADVEYSKGYIKSIVLSDGLKITANMFIDSSGDICLARAVGCEVATGRESFDIYKEPSAPATHQQELNGVTLVYRITPQKHFEIDTVCEDVPAKCWWHEHFPVACFNQYPCGDFNVNMLPTMAGGDAMLLSREQLMAECTRRVKAHWRNSQSIFEEFQHYCIKCIFPLPGIRESCRLVGRYVLTEHDLRAGISGQKHDDIIAIADHALDTHGYGDGCNELNAPYGVPLRCLRPKEFENLFVACRGASFSALAASSCRLSRTMMSLGEAAANACVAS